jgi:thiol-disulfide isomerase/thioredoxin
VAAGILIAVAMLAVIVGANTDAEKVAGPVDTENLPVLRAAPDLEPVDWINTEPISSRELRGKVVLYDFWTYSCVNCVRTFPYLRAWYDHYKSAGLVLIGVHSPEFDFERVHRNVEDAVKRDGVTWPVALDDRMTIWDEFSNRYWPSKYIADREGNIRYTHIGEGDYADTEDVIRRLLGVPDSTPRADTDADNGESPSLEHNPETYLGAQFQSGMQPFIVVHRGTFDYPAPEPGVITQPVFAGDNTVAVPRGKTTAALEGKWTVDDEKATSDEAVATIRLAAHAKEVNLVMATADGRPQDVIVQLDGQPVPAELRGDDVTTDENGRTIVAVHAPDMYRLFASPTNEDHLISISTTGPGLEAYSFTFG